MKLLQRLKDLLRGVDSPGGAAPRTPRRAPESRDFIGQRGGNHYPKPDVVCIYYPRDVESFKFEVRLEQAIHYIPDIFSAT